MPLKEVQIRNLRPKAAIFQYTDERGLYLEVHPNALGHYPEISLAEARHRGIEPRRTADGLSQDHRLPDIAPDAERRDRSWLFNIAAAGYVSDRLAVYAGYTRGLEESGIAPINAANRNEALPAIRWTASASSQARC